MCIRIRALLPAKAGSVVVQSSPTNSLMDNVCEPCSSSNNLFPSLPSRDPAFPAKQGGGEKPACDRSKGRPGYKLIASLPETLQAAAVLELKFVQSRQRPVSPPGVSLAWSSKESAPPVLQVLPLMPRSPQPSLVCLQSLCHFY
ncbi:hypothetical protein NUW54_g11258 [Trametes sanguinea]|uniref:Uncharacterized protein n=1 Tax=Trametes sanguinea TaxID=158606 RepID=A0ACC1NH22_9APHY|nr:hypothetical protein NUW54_g11258 [Trametes sanguinea]